MVSAVSKLFLLKFGLIMKYKTKPKSLFKLSIVYYTTVYAGK